MECIRRERYKVQQAETEKGSVFAEVKADAKSEEFKLKRNVKMKWVLGKQKEEIGMDLGYLKNPRESGRD